jgi:uncharacterized protein YeaO (DUF488 family)
MILTKSVYDPEGPNDGVRLLIMRRHPRGVKKSKYTHWIKDLAPSDQLLDRYRNGEITFEQFTKEFIEELATNFEVDDIIKELRRLYATSKRRNATLLCVEKEGENCHRHIVKEIVLYGAK